MVLTNTFQTIFGNDKTVTTLTDAKDSVDVAIGAAYTIANRVAIIAAVIALILCGIAFLLGNSNKRDMAQNKTVLTRIIGATGLIFLATAVVSWVVGMSI